MLIRHKGTTFLRGWDFDAGSIVNPKVVYVDPAQSANSTLTLTAGIYQSGIITVTVTGTSGTLVHSVDIILDVT